MTASALLRLFAGGGLLACAFGLVAVPARSFVLSGDVLNLDQRDLRLFDNFTQPSLHENNSAQSNWPGYLQVELALWKAAAEWGSLPFGDGSGDPLQAEVGSGRANFDFLWNGEAAGVGSTNDNIASQIPGSSGGVLAFIELPSSDGWRLRVYEDLVTWDDGPAAAAPGRVDFQGTMTHFLGHALGLGHSAVIGATMYPASSGNGESSRSIETDDAAGAQAVYGAMSPGKPRISAVSGSLQPGGSVAISGANFAAAGNDLWFNNDLFDAAAPGGEPAKLTGLGALPGGALICFTVPAGGIESGAIHVKLPGGGFDTLSEGQPFALGARDVDSILLTGPATGTTGTTATFLLQGAPPLAAYALGYSTRIGCNALQGHKVDLLAPIRLATSGLTDAAGAASWISPPIPPAASGLSLYLEAVAVSAGVIYDSNALRLDIL